MDLLLDGRYSGYANLFLVGLVWLAFLLLEEVNNWKIFFLKYIIFIVVIASYITSGMSGVIKGIDWHRARGIDLITLLNYKNKSNFLIEHWLYFDANIMSDSANFLNSKNLSSFRKGVNVPAEIIKYENIPNSLLKLMNNNSLNNQAINAAWEIYLVSGDLQSHFNIESKNFANQLFSWCSDASKSVVPGHVLYSLLTSYKNNWSELALRSKE